MLTADQHTPLVTRCGTADPPAPLVACCWTCCPDYPGMLVGPTCGNKRCPHATDHRHACTGSNEPGQPGSIYTARGPSIDTLSARLMRAAARLDIDREQHTRDEVTGDCEGPAAGEEAP